MLFWLKSLGHIISKNRMYNFTECYTEADMEILSFDSLDHDGLQNIQPDPEACRASCKLLGSDARYFTWAGPDDLIGNG